MSIEKYHEDVKIYEDFHDKHQYINKQVKAWAEAQNLSEMEGPNYGRLAEGEKGESGSEDSNTQDNRSLDER